VLPCDIDIVGGILRNLKVRRKFRTAAIAETHSDHGVIRIASANIPKYAAGRILAVQIPWPKALDTTIMQC